VDVTFGPVCSQLNFREVAVRDPIDLRVHASVREVCLAFANHPLHVRDLGGYVGYGICSRKISIR